MSRTKHRLPNVCVDEHITASVVAALRLYLRVFEARSCLKLRGRDDRDYLRELYVSNTVFVTSDQPFAEHVAEGLLRHAGLVWIPRGLALHKKEWFAEVSAAFIRGGCRDSKFAFRNSLLYPRHDGVGLKRGKQDTELVISWGEVEHWDSAPTLKRRSS